MALDAGIGFLATFEVVGLVVENLPYQTGQLVGDGPDGGWVAELGDPAAEGDLKMGALLLDRGLGWLREDAAQEFIISRG
jgi:hypothetical protein